ASSADRAAHGRAALPCGPGARGSGEAGSCSSWRKERGDRLGEAGSEGAELRASGLADGADKTAPVSSPTRQPSPACFSWRLMLSASLSRPSSTLTSFATIFCSDAAHSVVRSKNNGCAVKQILAPGAETLCCSR